MVNTAHPFLFPSVMIRVYAPAAIECWIIKFQYFESIYGNGLLIPLCLSKEEMVCFREISCENESHLGGTSPLVQVPQNIESSSSSNQNVSPA